MSAMGPAGVRSVRFGVFEVDLRAGELRKQGVKVKLQEQPFQILQVLLNHPGEVVTREDLRQRIWPADTFVDFDHGLYNAIKRLREALGDSADNPRFIETLSRRGYRFIGSITHSSVPAEAENKGSSAAATAASTNGSVAVARDSPDATAEAAPAPAVIEARQSAALPMFAAPTAQSAKSRFARRLSRRVLIMVLIMLMVFGALAAFSPLRDRLLGHRGSPPIRSLAVLPLQNLSGNPAQEYFADGMTDALITELSKIGSLRVVSRTTMMRYKQSPLPLPQIARELNVDGVVEGTVQRSGNRVRITAQLIQAPTDRHLWANSYERDLQDVLALEGDIARGITQEIGARITPQEKERFASRRPIKLRALEAYLKGKYYYDLTGTDAYSPEKAAAHEAAAEQSKLFFEQAIAEDPGYAAAYLGLADLLQCCPSTEDPVARATSAKNAALKALELDPQLAEGHAFLGQLAFVVERNWPEAEKELTRAIELKPNLAAAHETYALYLDSMGRLDEGMREYEILQQLDPDNPDLPRAYFDRGQLDHAFELAKNRADRRANKCQGIWQLAVANERIGRLEEAFDLWLRVTDCVPLPASVAEAGRRAYRTGGARRGMTELVRQLEILARKADIPPAAVAYGYTIVGNKDRAFVWLEKAVEDRRADFPDMLDVLTLNVNPMWDPIRSDPRFADLVRRVGLPH